VGGLPEVIEHGRTGFLARVGDVETMARYAIETLADDTKLNEMAARARAAAQARYCTSKIIPQYEDFYRKVLERAS
jgi:glycosyltransferase involved in cell wall biosynthesis